MPDDDARDERLGAWLEVDPLDELTRRRLVTTALASTGEPERRPSYTARWIAVAASIVVILVATVALLTAPGGNDEQQASTPVGTPEAAQKSAGVQAESAAPLATGAAPVDLGDFGDLGVTANLARLRAALGADTATASAPGTTDRTGRALDQLPCRDGLPVGTMTASATGTLDGRRAVVVLTILPDGGRSVAAVLADPCEVRPLS